MHTPSKSEGSSHHLHIGLGETISHGEKNSMLGQRISLAGPCAGTDGKVFCIYQARQQNGEEQSKCQTLFKEIPTALQSLVYNLMSSIPISSFAIFPPLIYYPWIGWARNLRSRNSANPKQYARKIAKSQDTISIQKLEQNQKILLLSSVT